ncbi:MAG: hypothetical protein II077_05420 [Treponema sp.]|nr:hypothetical protein [Treponema sp.]
MKILQIGALTLLMLACVLGVIACLRKIAGILSGDGAFKKAVAGLPVLTSDEEISEAIRGESKVYLVKDCVFYDGEGTGDTALNVLKGEYLCIKIQKETYVARRRHGKYETYWTRDEFADLRGKFRFNNGVSFEVPQGVRVEFPLIAYSRFKKDDVRAGFEEKYSLARYYPAGVKLDLESIKEKMQNPTVRYAYAFMKRGEKATFAARIGKGRVDLNVLDGKNEFRIGLAEGSFLKMTDIQTKDIVPLLFLFIGLILSFAMSLMFLVLLVLEIAGKL